LGESGEDGVGFAIDFRDLVLKLQSRTVTLCSLFQIFPVIVIAVDDPRYDLLPVVWWGWL
jgi:hypothetical protein